MPHDQRRRSCDEYDVISSDFPPPSLKPAVSPEQDKRKKKKWSIGGLFRRKKKVSDTDSSSPLEDEEEKKGFLERRRARKRKNRGSKDVTGSFEAVIINHRQSQVFENTEPRDVPNERVGRSHESLGRKENHVRGSSVSLEGTGRRSGRLQVKARVEESRERLKGDTSSDEGGGSSKHSQSSIQRIKCDDNISKDGSLSRRSRAARTERYKKRLSKDDESLRDFRVPSRISRSDERLSSKKSEKSVSNNRWTAKVVYYESSDYDTKYTAITKSATPSPVQSPKARPKNALHYTNSAPPASNYVTYPPPSHAREGVVGSHQELRSQHYPVERVPSGQKYPDMTPPRLPKSNSDMIAKPAQFTNSVQRQYPSWGQDALNRKSASYDCNVNSIHYVNNQISQPHPTDENVLVVQFPLSRPVHKLENKVKMGLHSLQHGGKQQNPPPPPPRDPHRRLVSSNGFHESSPRPMSYAFEDRSPIQGKCPGYPEFGSSSSAFQRVTQSQAIPIELEPVVSINRHQRSCSDNHLPSRISVKQSPPTSRRILHSDQGQKHHQDSLDMYASSPPSDHLHSSVPGHYQYYTDQHPRSRKPIHIGYLNQKPQNDPYLSDSQVIVKPPLQQTPRNRPQGVQNAADFWKQKDQENAKKIHISEGSPKLIQRHLLNLPQGNERSRSNSPMKDGNVGIGGMKPKLAPLIIPSKRFESSNSLSSSSPRDIPSPRITNNLKKTVYNEIGIPVFEHKDFNSNTKRPLSMLEEKQETSEREITPAKEKPLNPPTPPKRKDSKVNAVTSFEHFDILSGNENEDVKRKSSNLEEALNELETIYKSLRLGEDAYIEKIAKDQAVYENNRLDPSNWNAWVQSRGFESDSSFNYSRSSLESVDSVDSPMKSPGSRRGNVPDRVTDDMAYRRLNKKNRPPPQEQEVISQAGSFLLVSPTLSPPPFIEPPPVPSINKEPDVEKDDVVYRSIKHVNNTLKCLDPQPPFGIPLGPITPAPNSDYLHVSPTESYRPSFKPRKIPDVVTDDLAFRNLRKDNNKEPLFTAEDKIILDSPTLKKKRAVRSLSANLLSIIQRESLAMKNNNNKLVYNNNTIEGELEKSQSFTDVKDALNVNGRVTNGNFIHQRQILREASFKKNLSGEDSDVTPRVSRVFSTGTSSPLTATSTETLTGSKNSLLTTDLKSGNAKVSKSPSPRLSLTPERRHTTEIVNYYQPKPISPPKNHSVKNDSPKQSFSTSYPKYDFQRSPTPDSHTFTHTSNRSREDTPPVCDQKESDLLAILAREAKEASEQLSKELHDLNFDQANQPSKNYSSESFEITNEQIDKKDIIKCQIKQTQSKPLPIGKIIPHKPVKLSTFSITEDNKLECKQTEITNKPIEIESSKSMSDLLRELTESLDIDFGTPPKEIENQFIEKEKNVEKVEEHNYTETKCEEIDTDDKNHTIDPRECEGVPLHEDVSDERFSSPEKFLQSFVAEAFERQREHAELNSLETSKSLSDNIDNDNVDKQDYVDSITTDTQQCQSVESVSDKLEICGEPFECVEHVITAEDESFEEIFKRNFNSNGKEQESKDVDEMLNTLKEESSEQNERLSPQSSPLPKRFPLKLPEEDVLLEERPSNCEALSHSPIEDDSGDLLRRCRTPDESPAGTSREMRVTTTRPRDCIDCPRMTDEGTKTMADPGTLLLACMACANLIAGLELDFLAILGLVLAIACLFLVLLM